MDNSVQEARIHSNDLSNVATAAAAATTHLNNLTVNNSHNNITNANIQVPAAHLQLQPCRRPRPRRVQLSPWPPPPGSPSHPPPGWCRPTSAATRPATTTTKSGGDKPEILYVKQESRFHERHGSLIKLLNKLRHIPCRRTEIRFPTAVGIKIKIKRGHIDYADLAR